MYLYIIGQSGDLDDRIVRHNSGRSEYTKSGRPWILIHGEGYKTRSEAIKRERFLKSPAGWFELRKVKEKFDSEHSEELDRIEAGKYIARRHLVFVK